MILPIFPELTLERKAVREMRFKKGLAGLTIGLLAGLLLLAQPATVNLFPY
jgi:hypothetical protein